MKIIAFDTETKGLDWFDENQRAFLGSWADANGEYHADLSKEAGRREFLDALKSADILVAHNMPFDVHQVRETLGYDIRTSGKVLHDTDLMARVAWPGGQDRPSYRLKDLAEVYLDDDSKKDEEHIVKMGKSIGVTLKGPNADIGGFYDVWRAYPEVMEKYARTDARLTYDLHDILVDILEDHPSWELEKAVQPTLIKAESIGVRLDRERVKELDEEYARQNEVSKQRLLAQGCPPNALEGKGSGEVMEKWLTEDMGIPLYRKTKEGKLQVNKFALAEFEEDYPVLEVLSDYKTTSKFLSTYTGPMKGRDVIHTSFGQSNAWTSRMSSYRPNMQNIPKRAGKEVREVFVPREDHAFVVSDYDSIEVRLLAHYLGKESYRSLIREGLDPHAWMAAQIHGGTPEDFSKDGPNDDKRSAAKNTLFAIVYGAGAPRVSDMNKITKEEARELIARIKGALPGYHRLNGRIRKKVRVDGFVTTITGRKNPINPEKAYVGLNGLIQGSAAGIMKQGLINAQRSLEPLGGTPLLVVHDELLTEVPIENAEQAQQEQDKALVSAYDLDPPLEVTSSIVTTNYADA